MLHPLRFPSMMNGPLAVSLRVARVPAVGCPKCNTPNNFALGLDDGGRLGGDWLGLGDGGRLGGRGLQVVSQAGGKCSTPNDRRSLAGGWEPQGRQKLDAGREIDA